MNLNDAQRQKVAQWIAEGSKLSEIQNRLGSEFGLRVTYMEVRLLVDDLKLTPKDVEKTAPADLGAAPQQASKQRGGAPQPEPAATTPEPAPATSGVSISLDQIARPGAVVSGKVTFSDGKSAEWYFDQTGRLGLAPSQQGYRPSQKDIQEFQLALDKELSRLGYY